MENTNQNKTGVPNYTKNEERFHMASHIIGSMLGVLALVLCLYRSVTRQGALGIAASIVYGVCMTALYAVSSAYHGLNPKRPIKKIFRTIDHCSIFLLIAGTYTPIALCAIRGQNAALGWSIFGVIWVIAILGITLNAIDVKKYQIFSLLCYLVMGWGIMIFVKPLYLAVDGGGLALLVAGGICYSAGAVIYAALKKIRYSHSAFHILCLAGSTLHFLCIYLYVL